MLLTVKVKLIPSEEQKNKLLETMGQFNTACNKISKIAYEQKVYNKIKLQKICYYIIKDEFKLCAQLTIRAIAKVSDSYKVNMGTLHKFDSRGAIMYDSRILSYKKSLDKVSIKTLNGRVTVPIAYDSYTRLCEKRIKGRASLVYINDDLYLYSIVDVQEEALFTPNKYMGVKLSIVNITTTSDGVVYPGANNNKIRQRFARLKTVLQEIGTKSAKRHLKKIAGKEKRFKTNTNHIISKELVNVAKGTKRAIVMEDTINIRSRATVRREQHAPYGKWTFDQLREFIKYKAKLAGVPVTFVNSKYILSSQCSVCGYVDNKNRKTQNEFECLACGYTELADHNTSKNILARAIVNKPIVASKRFGAAS